MKCVEKSELPEKRAPMNTYSLEAIGISKSYTVDERRIIVLDDITLSVPAGEFLVIEGKSGSGKSTLLSILSGLDKPDSGRIKLDAADITDLSEDELAPYRNRTTGFVFQAFHLVPSLTALENVMFPAELNNDSAAAAKAGELLKRVNLVERMNNFPHQLSGGEMQRVALCRALVNGPKIVFADEPTGNLDSSNSDAILELLGQLHKEQGSTLVLATHSREIAQMAERVLILRDGRIVDGGKKNKR